MRVQFVIIMAQSTVHNCEVLRCTKSDTVSMYSVSLLCGMLAVQKKTYNILQCPYCFGG